MNKIGITNLLVGLLLGMAISSFLYGGSTYKRSIPSNAEIPTTWCTDTVGDIAFGKIAEYDVEGFLVKTDFDWDRIKVFRRSGDAIAKTLKEIKRKMPNMIWSVKVINGKTVQIAQYPILQDVKAPPAERLYFVEWSADEDGTAFDIGLVIAQYASSKTLDKHVEHLLSTMDWQDYEKNFINIAENYTDIGPTNFEWWETWSWSPEQY